MVAKQKFSPDSSTATIGKTVDDAMVAIERDNPRLKGVLPKDNARPGLDKHRLGELIDLIGGIDLVERAPSPPGRYVGAEEVEDDGDPFEEKMPRLVSELESKFAESAKLEAPISANLKSLNFTP